MKKIFLIISAAVLLIIAAITATTFAYARTSDYDSSVLPDKISVNGVDCSGLTYEEAAAKISEEWNRRSLVVFGTLNEEITDFTDFGCTYDIVGEISKIKNNYMVFAAANKYLGLPVSVRIPMIIESCSDEFRTEVESAAFLNRAGATESRDAYVDMSDPEFPIVKEHYGTEADKEKFFKDLLMHIQTGDMKMIYDERSYYTMPEVTADSSKLLEYQKFCREYLDQKITYQLGEETFTISSQQLQQLMKDGYSGEADEEKVAAYVASLAEKYDNVGISRSFTSLSGKKINVSGGLYGWTIDQEKETAQLVSDINSHKDVSRKPAYSAEGYGEYSQDLGDTYIDVDISTQKVRFYKEGSLVFSCDTVTGCRVNGTLTPTGTYYVINKARNVVLRGDNVDGSQYESPVKYWMGINWTGIGFHDADWRSSFGGSIWISNGSHGCINIPPSKMGDLYNKAETDMPVVVHY